MMMNQLKPVLHSRPAVQLAELPLEGEHVDVEVAARVPIAARVAVDPDVELPTIRTVPA